MVTNILIRPELRTSSGEVSDIFREDDYIGTMTLVFRESDRLLGAIQLEDDNVSANVKDDIITYLQSYIQSLVEALDIELCEVLVSYGGYQYVIDEDWISEQFPSTENEIKHEEIDIMELELELVEKDLHRCKFQITQSKNGFIANATAKMKDTKISCTINFRRFPSNDEIENVTLLLMNYFNKDDAEVFRFKIKASGKHIETLKITSTSPLLEKQKKHHVNRSKHINKDELNEENYDVRLIRNDGDALTYEIYHQSTPHQPIGIASIDIGEKEITGYIDFQDPRTSDERELIATLLLEELDKEREYDKINLSMFVKNECIDEIEFETEEVNH